MKRAVGVWATSVALFVCSIGAHATVTLEEWMKALPPDTIVSNKRLKPTLKTSSGNLSLFRSAGNPWATAIGLGAAGLSIVFEDEINQSLFELFLGSNQPATEPGGSTDPLDPSYWESGKYWFSSGIGYSGATKNLACEAYATSLGFSVYNVSGSTCQAPHPAEGVQWQSLSNLISGSCTPTEGSTFCPTTDPNPEVMPDNGTVEGKLNAGGIEYFDADPNKPLTPLSNPTYFAVDSSTIGKLTVGADNKVTVETFAKITTPDGNTATAVERVTMGQDGTVYSTSQQTVPGSPVDVITKSDPSSLSVSMDLPTDYARENTLVEIRDSLSATDPGALPDTATANQPLFDLKTEIEGQGAVLGDIPLIGDLGASGGGLCKGITLDFGIYGGVQTFDKHCQLIDGMIRPALEYLLALTTLIYLVRLYRTETTRTV